MSKVYVVNMHRYNRDFECCIGVFINMKIALERAKSEEDFRGVKYSAKISEYELDIEYFRLDTKKIPKVFKSSGEQIE